MQNSPFSRRNPERKRRPSTLTIPERACPHVRFVFAEMRRQGITYDALEEKSGVLRATLKAWRHKNYPSLPTLEAALGFLGWDFVPVPRGRALPPDLVAELAPIAERLGLTMPAVVEALVEIVSSSRTPAALEAA